MLRTLEEVVDLVKQANEHQKLKDLVKPDYNKTTSWKKQYTRKIKVATIVFKTVTLLAKKTTTTTMTKQTKVIFNIKNFQARQQSNQFPTQSTTNTQGQLSRVFSNDWLLLGGH
jgi:hypothetical protein